MAQRILRFQDIVGHNELVEKLISSIHNQDLPNFILFHGSTGLGKTSLMDLVGLGHTCEASPQLRPCYKCPTCLQNLKQVIIGGKESSSIKKFTMSEDGGIEQAKAVKEQMTTSFTKGRKYIKLDEVHGMIHKAQDVLLTATEYIPDGVMLCVCTTDITNLSDTFLSRCTHYYVNKLKKSEMIYLLKRESSNLGLTLDNSDLAFNLIADYTQCRPRAGIKILEGMGRNRAVKLSELRYFINFIDPGEFTALLNSFENGLSYGIDIILNMDIDAYSTQNNLCR